MEHLRSEQWPTAGNKFRELRFVRFGIKIAKGNSVVFEKSRSGSN
jgi:hypothetical protein